MLMRVLPLRVVFVGLAVLSALGPAAAPVLAQPSQAPAGWSSRVAAGIVHQGEADLDGGGALAVTRLFATAEFSRAIEGGTRLGWEIGASYDDHRFLGVEAPWRDLRRFEASFSYARQLSADWAVRVAPSLKTHYAEGSSAGDGVVASVVAAATRTFNPDLRLGLGVVAATGLEETRAFPFVAIRWAVSERWTVQNPLRAGPAGPAGLEAVWEGAAWDVALGGAYRSYRFALGDDAAVAGGIGEHNGVPLFVRLTRRFGDSGSISTAAWS